MGEDHLASCWMNVKEIYEAQEGAAAMSSEKKNNDYLLEVEHLKQYFPVHQGFSTIPLKAGRFPLPSAREKHLVWLASPAVERQQ